MPIRPAAAAAALLLPCAAAAQTLALPAGRLHVAADAAMSLPLRWSQGTLQMQHERGVLETAGLPGRTVRALRMRRPVGGDEPAYGPLRRRLEVTVAWTGRSARELLPETDRNLALATRTTAVFTAADVSVPATQPPGRGDAVGATTLRLPLDVPFAVPAQAEKGAEHLIVEVRTLEAALHIEAGHWVEAIWFPGGKPASRAHPVGGAGCGSARVARPMRLGAMAAPPPQWGKATPLRLADALPQAPALLLLGIDPTQRRAALDAVPFGGELAALGMPGCHGWTPWDVLLPAGTTTAAGGLDVSVALPDLQALRGHRIGVQVAAVDAGSNPLGIALSNGWVLAPDPLPGVGGIASVLVLGPARRSDWSAFLGAAPVLVVEV